MNTFTGGCPSLDTQAATLDTQAARLDTTQAASPDTTKPASPDTTKATSPETTKATSLDTTRAASPDTTKPASSDATKPAGADSDTIESAASDGRNGDCDGGDLAARATKAWMAYEKDPRPSPENPPDFREFADCFEVHKAFVLRLKGLNDGHLRSILRHVQSYFLNRGDFPISSKKLGRVETARQVVLDFLANARAIISREDSKKALRARQIKDDEDRRLRRRVAGRLNNNERTRLICIGADPGGDDVRKIYLKQVSRAELDEEVPTFASTFARKYRNREYFATVPAVPDASNRESVLFALDPNNDINYERSAETLEYEFRAMRSKYDDCMRNFRSSGQGSRTVWSFCMDDPVMLLIHEIECLGTEVLSFFTCRLPRNVQADSSCLDSTKPESRCRAPSRSYHRQPQKKRARKDPVLDIMASSMQKIAAAVERTIDDSKTNEMFKRFELIKQKIQVLDGMGHEFTPEERNEIVQSFDVMNELRALLRQFPQSNAKEAKQV